MDSQIVEDDSSIQMKILSNSIRQRILKLVAEQGSISFTAIKEELELTDGSLFYHLKNLDSYIQKDQQNFYQLNEKGKKIVEDIIHKISLPDTEEEKKSWFIDKLAFRELYYYFFGDPVRSLIELNIFLIVVAWLFGVSNTHFSSVESILEGGAIINGLLSIAHWYLYLAVVFLTLKTLKNESNIKELWVGIFVGIIPYIVYLIPIGIIHYTNTAMEGWLLILMNIVFAIVKIISAIFVSQGIYLSTNCKQYQAVIIASALIIIDYIYLMIMM
ncbi:MAG: helix-turn-helix transcriptional regulator [Asgard group archaeon]|nr:helix-turn-helix transcriptional regulator [Asgard group archaeon]